MILWMTRSEILRINFKSISRIKKTRKCLETADRHPSSLQAFRTAIKSSKTTQNREIDGGRGRGVYDESPSISDNESLTHFSSSFHISALMTRKIHQKSAAIRSESTRETEIYLCNSLRRPNRSFCNYFRST